MARLIDHSLPIALALMAAPALAQEAAPAPALPVDGALPPVDPVISDREFEAAIPPLEPGGDPELERPLESIEAFERRLAGQAPQGQPPVDQPPMGHAEAAIGSAPVRDAELAAPLPPLDQFEVAPVQFAEKAADEAKEASVAYRVQIDGLDKIDKQVEAGLNSEFNALSVLKQGDGKAANTAMVRARLGEDSQLLQTILAAQGWYTPTIRTRLVPPRDGDAALTAVLAVVPGKRYSFGEIVIKADPTEPPDLIARNLPLQAGDPIVAERVQGAEARVAVALPENGYPFAELGERDLLLDPDSGTGVYTLPVTTGPRGRFGAFVTDGKPAFHPDHIRRLARFRRGDLYDSRKVDDLRKALVATNLFRAVSVEPQRGGPTGEDGSQYVTLNVHQEAGPPRTIAGSVGYAAGEGLTAEATWTHRNLFPPEGAVIAHGLAGTQRQGAGVTFRRSNAGRRDRTFEVVAEAFHNTYDAYSAYTGRLAARVSRDSTPIWQKRLTYAFGAELLATGETDYVPATGDRKRRTYYVAGINGQVGLDTTDDLLDAARGYRVTALVQPEATVRGGIDPYVRARIDASAYQALSDGLVLAGRIRLGTIQGTGDLFDIAPSRRLYAGGGGSVRGYVYQGLGEQAADRKPTGGRSLNEASVEARYRFGNYGIVAFADAGQAYRETLPRFSDLRYGVGIGGRFYTNFGPFRLDVATPLGRRKGEPRLNIYVSLGQAF